MSSLKTIEKRVFEDLFDMGGGYVLDFSNHTFADSNNKGTEVLSRTKGGKG